ncbi:MAG: helix-turn-helix domain-containing protein [Bacteroidales bacterium]|jgi:hypothetical protein|nr:helix-turn-helix domain-containing protein [Bacteroidales bacterium]
MITPDTHNPVFQLAADFVNQTSQHVFLTGKAGTGKTTFLKYIRENTHKNCIVAAPTGVAAINAGGVTLHSLFQLPFEPFIPGLEYRNSKERFRMSGSKLDMLRRMELLIIDEVSMLRVDVLDAIDTSLRRIRKNDQPFGNVQLLYIGDLFQLPPVVKEDEWSILRDYYSSPFFFHAKSVQRIPPVYLELKKVYRQREQLFVDLLNRVRNNELTQTDLKILNQRYCPGFESPPEEKYITLTTRNAKADEINNRELGKLTSEIFRFEGEITGEFPEYALPTEMVLTLKEGAQIMFIKNDSGEFRRYYNGKLGTITRIKHEQIWIKLEGTNEIIEIEREKWTNIRYTLNKETAEIEEEELGAFMQYPIRLAWAITIHKSQGLTFERAVIDTGDAFAPGQSYVALSRCTSLEGIILLSPITPDSVQTNRQAVSMSKSEKQQAELIQILEEKKRHFWADRLLLYFDCEELTAIPHRLNKLIDDKTSGEFQSYHTLVKEMMAHAYELKSVSERFKTELRSITRQPVTDIHALSERCNKAVGFFHRNILEKMLLPLQQYINGFKVKKAKTFYKHLCNLELDLKQFIENMKKVRYNNIPLIDGNDFLVPDRKGLYEQISQEGKKVSGKTGTKQKVDIPSKKKENEPHIYSNQKSYDLFLEGFSVEEIAQMREISQSTVISHLAEYIQNGKLSVLKLLSQDKVEKLSPWIQAAIAEDNFLLSPIKDRVGDQYSYTEIRLVMSHCIHEKTKNVKE